MRAVFLDPVSGHGCELVAEDGITGIWHPGCDRLADIAVELDAFYCPACKANGRVSGTWCADMLSRGGGAWSTGPSLHELDAGETGEQCIHCLRFTYDPHTDRCWRCGRGLRPAYGLEAGTIECPMCGVLNDRRCSGCGGCDCECVCGEDW